MKANADRTGGSVSWAVGRGLSLEDRSWEGEVCHDPCHTPVSAFWAGAGSAEARGGAPAPGRGGGVGREVGA